MFEPAPRELCEILQKMGCVSESSDMGGFYWTFFEIRTPQWDIEYFNPEDPESYSKIQCYNIFKLNAIPVFFQNDFTGATELANENSHIVFEGPFVCALCFEGTEDKKCSCVLRYSSDVWVHWIPFHQAKRIQMIELRQERWFEFLKRTMKHVN